MRVLSDKTRAVSFFSSSSYICALVGVGSFPRLVISRVVMTEFDFDLGVVNGLDLFRFTNNPGRDSRFVGVGRRLKSNMSSSFSFSS